MRMTIATGLAIAALLSGCAGLRLPELASCDGTERRPLNRAQWQSQEHSGLGSVPRACG
jgi:hypothetical protein